MADISSLDPKFDLIESVISIFSKEGVSFNIPDYQRGYKWTDDNINELLDDVNKFKMDESNPDAFYCIQNITLVNSGEGNQYNVIDGQQRLTTLGILLCFIGKQNLVANKLCYSVRESTGQFIKDWIVSRRFWTESCAPEPKHMDEWYIQNAARVIQKWYDTKGWLAGVNGSENKSVEESVFEEKLCEHTKLIVNILSERGTEHQTFANINSVKVPLDGADLIRAILITRSLNDILKGSPTVATIRTYRVRMGMELDEMAIWWKNDDIKLFFGRMIPEKFDNAAKLQNFNKDVHPIDTLYLLYYLSKGKNVNEFSIRFFEENNDYLEFRSLHNSFKDWFNDRDIYHYLGFLYANYPIRLPFSELHTMWESSRDRSDFVGKIKAIICEELVKGYAKEGEQLSYTDAKERLLGEVRKLNTNWYGDNSSKCSKLLALRDILLLSKSKDTSVREPVSFFGSNNENLEHIGCQNPCEEKMNDKQYWVDCIDSLPNDARSEFSKLKEEIEKAESVDETLRIKIKNQFTELGFNSIGNLVLLNGSVNQGFGNAKFSNKKMAIINNYYNYNKGGKTGKGIGTKGAYIRPWTLNVFIGTEKNDWGSEEISKSLLEISEELSAFLSNKQE